jgi:hypothetical protein
VPRGRCTAPGMAPCSYSSGSRTSRKVCHPPAAARRRPGPPRGWTPWPRSADLGVWARLNLQVAPRYCGPKGKTLPAGSTFPAGSRPGTRRPGKLGHGAPRGHPAPGHGAQLRPRPVVLLAYASSGAYVARYAERTSPEGTTSRAAAHRNPHWPVPYWTGDAAFGVMTVLLAAVDAGLGACIVGTSSVRTCWPCARRPRGVAPLLRRPAGPSRRPGPSVPFARPGGAHSG